MTIGAAHDDEAPEPGPVTCEQVRADWDALTAQYAALMADVAADRDRPDLARRVSALTVALREASNRLAGHSFADAFAAEKTAVMAAVPGRHRAGPARRIADVVPLRRPRPAHGLAPAAALALAGHGTRHALTAHLRLGLTAAAAAGVTAAGVTYTIQETPNQRPAPSAAAPAAAAPSAVALPAPSHVRTVRRHRRNVRRVVAPPLAFPSPAPSPASATPAPPAAGVLDVQAATVTLQPSAPGQYSGQLVLYATGGPVRWRIDQLGTSAALRFDQAAGFTLDGQPAAVTVTVDAAQVTPGQTWTITLDPGGQQVTVTTAGLSRPAAVRPAGRRRAHHGEIPQRDPRGQEPAPGSHRYVQQDADDGQARPHPVATPRQDGYGPGCGEPRPAPPGHGFHPIPATT